MLHSRTSLLNIPDSIHPQRPAGLFVIRSLLTQLSNQRLGGGQQKDGPGGKFNNYSSVINGNLMLDNWIIYWSLWFLFSAKRDRRYPVLSWRCEIFYWVTIHFPDQIHPRTVITVICKNDDYLDFLRGSSGNTAAAHTGWGEDRSAHKRTSLFFFFTPPQKADEIPISCNVNVSACRN